MSASLQSSYGLYHAIPTTFPSDVLAFLIRSPISALSSGTLPCQVVDQHSICLSQPALVQIDDVISISHADPRESGGVRQFSLCDGKQIFAAVELAPLPWTNVMSGAKAVLQPGCILRRGRLLLTPQTVRFLGSPRESVWGPDHQKLEDESLAKAGLPKRGQSTFDSIVDMGGIADLEQDEEDGDEGFWREVVSVADRAVSQRPESRSNPQENVQLPPTHRGSAGTTGQSLVRRSNTAQADRSHRSNLSMAGRPTNGPTPMSIANPPLVQNPATLTDAPLEIPDMPMLESDPGRLSPLLEADEETGCQNPLSYLSNASSSGVLRCYAPRTLRRLLIQNHNNEVILSTLLDDGTSIRLMRLADPLVRELSQGLHPERDTDELRKRIRSTCGFVRVERGVLVDIRRSGPPGMVSYVPTCNWSFFQRYTNRCSLHLFHGLRTLSNIDLML